MKPVALLGDSSDHGGALISHNQSGNFTVGGVPVAVDRAQHSCPIPFHGITFVSAVTLKSFCEGKLILTEGAVAGCGALISPVDRGVYCE